MTVTMKVNLLLFIIFQGGIIRIVCSPFLQFKQIKVDFWYLLNLTYQIDKNSRTIQVSESPQIKSEV